MRFKKNLTQEQKGEELYGLKFINNILENDRVKVCYGYTAQSLILARVTTRRTQLIMSLLIDM